MEGQVLCGINNIYTVLVNGKLLTCRIKGKVFREGERSYNPIAVGDTVEILPDPISTETGWITGRVERKSSLVRWNRKGKAPQVIAANADLLVCVTSPKSPPFRPRFLDRLIISGEKGKMSVLVLVNKSDLGIGKEVEERIKNYRSIGYTVITCSAMSGQGIGKLAKAMEGRVSVLVGQSGVGKSSLLNRMEPGLALKVGDLSSKFDRGSHTTSFASLMVLQNGLRVIDTPGIRELELADLLPEELPFFFPEFSPWYRECAFPSCLHIGEPSCAVKSAFERGEIHPDRYESYVRISYDLRETQELTHG